MPLSTIYRARSVCEVKLRLPYSQKAIKMEHFLASAAYLNVPNFLGFWGGWVLCRPHTLVEVRC